MTAGDAGRLRGRAAVAARVVAVVNGLSRAAGRGSGTVIGGRAGIAVDPELLASLAAGRQVVLVTGTNGKTTTTGLLAAALTGDGVEVATNATGANMPPGHVAALVAAPGAGRAVLEVDESYLGAVADATAPDVIVLLNLSRDQLDRIAEVRMLVDRWREVLARLPTTTVVANADDPLVVHAASAAARTRWVRAGQVWRHDAVGCPACGGRIIFSTSAAVGWACDACGFARPGTDYALVGHELVVGAVRFPMTVALPGAFNRANAAMAVAAATALPGVDGGDALTPAVALERVATVTAVAGRFATSRWKGRELRLLLAKNPAGWTAIFDLFDEDAAAAAADADGSSTPGPACPAPPLVLSVNARTADGFDTSWLWDVPFERLAGRTVVATGERCRDLAVRLRYAEVEHTTVPAPRAALDATVAATAAEGAAGRGRIEVLANYTAFADLRALR